MSLASVIGLEKLPPEIADALRPILIQVEDRVEEITKTSLDRVDGLVEAALDRIDGMQIILVATIKLPRPGAKMADPANAKVISGGK